MAQRTIFYFLFVLLVVVLEYGIWDHDPLTIVAGAITVTLTWLLRWEILLQPEKGRR